MQVSNLLKDRKLLTDDIKEIDYHMNLLNCDVEKLVSQMPFLANKTENELARCILNIYKFCDVKNPEYDSKLDEEMTRIGLQTAEFYESAFHKRNSMFSSEYDGFGNEVTSIYDDYIDSTNERSGR